MFGALADLCKLELVDAIPENVVQGKSVGALEGRAGTQAGAEGDVAREHGVESLHLAAALDRFAAHAENVARPLLFGLVRLFETEFHVLVIIKGIRPDLLGAVHLDLGHDPAVDGTREHIAAVIVGMLADEVDAAGGSIKVSSFPEQGLELFLDSFFHIGVVFSVSLQR